MLNFHITANVSAVVQSVNEARSRICLVKGQQMVSRAPEEKWRSPPSGWAMINTDRAFSHMTPSIACGGFLRNDLGELLKAFMFKGEEGDSLIAELWGYIHGLKLAWDLGLETLSWK